MNKEKGKFFNLNILSELMHFVKPYKGIYYFVLGAAIFLSIFSIEEYPVQHFHGCVHSIL